MNLIYIMIYIHVLYMPYCIKLHLLEKSQLDIKCTLLNRPFYVVGLRLIDVYNFSKFASAITRYCVMVRRLCISVYVLFSIKVRETCNIQLAKRFFIKHIAVSSNLLSSYFSPFVHSIFDIDMNNMYGLSWSLSFCILKVA